MGSKIYFASDFHLGLDMPGCSSREREIKIVRWLDSVKDHMSELYLVGDIFDHWFEYKTVIPKGFTRFLGKIAELRDNGIPVYLFCGNHDLWMFDYFSKEFDIPIIRSPLKKIIGEKTFYIAHGDGLGPHDVKYKILKFFMTNPICQWIYARLHPNTGIRLMKYFSSLSRHNNKDEDRFLGIEKEWLFQFAAAKKHEDNEIDFFIFGHRHLPIHTKLVTSGEYVNLGDWLTYSSYAEFDGKELNLRFFENPDAKINTI